MDFNTFVTQYGAWLGLAIYFTYKELWPWFRDKFLPHIAAEKRAERASLAKALDDHRAASQQREDRLFGVIEQTVAAMADIKGTLGNIKDAMATQAADTKEAMNAMKTGMMQLAEAVYTISLDLSALYGAIDIPRPSRLREQERKANP